MRASAENTTPIYGSLQRVAARYGYSVDTLRDLIYAGRLPAYRLSDKRRSAIRVKFSDVEALLTPVIPPEVTAAR